VRVTITGGLNAVVSGVFFGAVPSGDDPSPGSYQVISRYPHDEAAFTQGLILLDGKLYESTGLYGSSTLREVDLHTGAVLRKVDVPSQYFAEGMTIFQGKVFQLTWQSQTGFIYDPVTFNLLGQFSYTGEGWGLTHDDQHLIMSDGTNQIRFLDPVTFQTVRSIGVYDDEGRPLTNINELEYISGKIYANIWQTNWIVRIDPQTGGIVGWIDMTGLLPAGSSGDVLNGIAHDKASGHLLVTGKLWPWIFEINLQGSSDTAISQLAKSAP
jgi:glutamine cyclotransferase